MDTGISRDRAKGEKVEAKLEEGGSSARLFVLVFWSFDYCAD